MTYSTKISTVTAHLNKAVLTLSLNRPEKKNALTNKMYLSLAELLEKAASDQNIRLIILRGIGGNFTAGNDLKDFLEHPPVDENSAVVRFMNAWRDIPQITLVAVEGFAIGIGTTLLLHADLVIATNEAKFALPFTKLGLVPEYASSYLINQFAGRLRANELLLLGDAFDAETAKQCGLVNRVVDSSELEITLKEYLNKILKLAPEALLSSKKLLKMADQQAVKIAMDTEIKEFRHHLNSDEFKEAASAFFEKRAANFEK